MPPAAHPNSLLVFSSIARFGTCPSNPFINPASTHSICTANCLGCMHMLPQNGPRWSCRSSLCCRLAGHGKESVQGSVETADGKGLSADCVRASPGQLCAPLMTRP